jgi:nicotinate-nucleotide adenylyltransferase
MRLGIFGGTFDPVHNLHLFIAESARRLEDLDRVIFVPTNNVHYREKPAASAEQRYEMLKLAIATNDRFALDRSDLEPGATGYTADLLPRLHGQYPEDSFVFVTGADSLAESSWVRFEEVLESLEAFVIAPRAGIAADTLSRVVSAVPAALRSRIKTLNLPEMPESATLIRTMLAQGRSARYLVPEPVWEYITVNNVYAPRDEA